MNLLYSCLFNIFQKKNYFSFLYLASWWIFRRIYGKKNEEVYLSQAHCKLNKHTNADSKKKKKSMNWLKCKQNLCKI